MILSIAVNLFMIAFNLALALVLALALASAVASVSALASALAFTVKAFVQQRISSVRAAVILTTEPVFAAVFGFFLAGDRLKPIQILGGVFVIAGILTSEVLATIHQQDSK